MILLLESLSFERVAFFADIGEDGQNVRHVSVAVGFGRDWYLACRFPNIDSENGRSLGDDTLDDEVRERAAEELVRLASAIECVRARAAA